jgi:hypothetical protein
MSTRAELVAAITARYRSSNRQERTRILDEFVAVTGYHRKHAIRLLRTRERRVRCRYGPDVKEALIALWEASDRICSKRLKPLKRPCCRHAATLHAIHLTHPARGVKVILIQRAFRTAVVLPMWEGLMRHILVVDLDPGVSAVMQMGLEADGACRVTSAPTAEDGLA